MNIDHDADSLHAAIDLHAAINDHSAIDILLHRTLFTGWESRECSLVTIFSTCDGIGPLYSVTTATGDSVARSSRDGSTWGDCATTYCWGLTLQFYCVCRIDTL